MAEEEKIRGAGGVLLKGGQVLVIVEDESDQRYGKRAGMLSVPMGRVRSESGELPREAAEREFREESGYPVRVQQYLLEVPAPPAGVVKIYAMEMNGNVSIENGTLRPRWMSVEEFLSLPDERVRPPSKTAVRLALLWKKTASF